MHAQAGAKGGATCDLLSVKQLVRALAVPLCASRGAILRPLRAPLAFTILYPPPEAFRTHARALRATRAATDRQHTTRR